MVVRVDLYEAIHRLIDQIPEGMVSTHLSLAEALGDSQAARAISEALKLEEFQYAKDKIVAESCESAAFFCGFSSDLPLASLAEIQEAMSRLVIQEDGECNFELFAGADVAYTGDKAYASCIVMDEKFSVRDSANLCVETRFPYISGYLAFREAPAIEEVVGKVMGFDVLMVNGHGVAHPRGCGLASQVGLDLDCPTIGVAKRSSVGTVGFLSDSWAPVTYRDKVVGACLMQKGLPPIYVSVGHGVSLETSVGLVRRMRSNRRFPEPLREAHKASVEFRRRSLEAS